MSRNPRKFDEEELRILRDFERGEFESIQHFRKEKRSLEAAARRTLQKGRLKIENVIQSTQVMNVETPFKKAAF
jgi:hypothetical protein